MNTCAALDKNFASTMASYNKWMNRRLYDVVATLDDETRKKDMGAFFKSVHGTLNHILLADKIWMGRFVQDPFSAKALSEELYADFNELRSERAKQDQRIVEWAVGLSAEELAEDLRFKPVTAAQEKVLPMWLVVTHFFNHQTHHRGQITTLLMQLGIDPGATDLPVMPRSE
ncbi:MAG: DinB family protein [Pseudohongiella sp.]|nr:DinB family protein [Pseudohongiella sp.]